VWRREPWLLSRYFGHKEAMCERTDSLGVGQVPARCTVTKDHAAVQRQTVKSVIDKSISRGDSD